ncbi:MAG TPA: hypothetical protein VK742_15025 [Candidatus Sulfotelmatobacter sp.]|jgi:hypothetical protein|nr:hypothetical protein [Candidatus Sulfotelmatobacter sp.]
MNLRRKQPADSLYLLLDTLCNAFGGIILLAVLVVLLTSKEKTPASTPADSQERLQRRLELAQSNLQKAQQLAAKLQSQAANPGTRTQMDLLRSRKEIQDAIQQIREANEQNSKDLDSASAVDPAERLKFLNAQLAAARIKKLDTTNSLTVATENRQQLNVMMTDLEKQVTNKIGELQRPLRLPKEHETGKRVIYIIARYDKIYLCRNYDLSRNENDIKWTSTLTDEIAEPIEDKGIDPANNAAGLANFFKTLSDGTIYIAFCVYEDSFPAFIQAKQAASEAGLAYGWEPWLIGDGPVVFTAFGHTPKPQ